MATIEIMIQVLSDARIESIKVFKIRPNMMTYGPMDDLFSFIMVF
jgi:hypothetical protein